MKFLAIFSASAWASSRRRSGGSTIWLIIPSRVGPLRPDPLVASDESHPHHRLGRHLARKSDHLVRRNLTERYVGIDKGGVRRCHRHVGVGNEMQPAPGANAVDGDHDRLPNPVVPGGELQLSSLCASRMLSHGVQVGADLLEVDAGLEHPPVAGVDNHPDMWVVIELMPGVFELGEHLGVHGIPHVRSVEDEPPNRTPPLDDERLIAVLDHNLCIYSILRSQPDRGSVASCRKGSSTPWC